MLFVVRRLDDWHACIPATARIVALIVGPLWINPDQLVNISPTNRAKLATFATILADVSMPTRHKYVIGYFVILKANDALLLALRHNFSRRLGW